MMKRVLYIIFSIALVAIAVGAEAQVGKFYQPLGSQIEVDTVTNTGVSYVSTGLLNQREEYSSTVVQVVVTKISGTVGGTISLQGSIDGTNWKALNTNETQTALPTITATDASNVYHWRLTGSPFPYYRVSWTGTGTMAASFSAKYHRAK